MIMKTYRIQPALHDVPRLIEAVSAEAATDRVLRIVGYKTLDDLNIELYDGGPGDKLTVTEVSPDYLAALAVICSDPEIQNAPPKWQPVPETVNAILKAVKASGKPTRQACNMIMHDMWHFNIPAADWSWVPMMRLHGENV